MKCSDLFVACLETEGIRFIFGVPGEENADFMMSLEASRLGDPLRAHAARAGRRVHGRGIRASHGHIRPDAWEPWGPAATNLITGVADGNMDRAPMLVLTGQGELGAAPQGVAPGDGRGERCSSRSRSGRRPCWHPDNIPEIVRKAVRLARTEKPGACHIELPEDIAEARRRGDAADRAEGASAGRSPDEKIVDRALGARSAKARAADHPGRQRLHPAARERAAAADSSSDRDRRGLHLHGARAASTWTTRRQPVHDRPAASDYRGDRDRAGRPGDLRSATTWSSTTRGSGTRQRQAHRPRRLRCRPRSTSTTTRGRGRRRPGPHAVDAERACFEAHLASERSGSTTTSSHRRRCARAHARGFRRIHADDDTARDRSSPQKALWDARQVLGRDDILLSDVGAHKMWIARYYQCHEPNTCLIPNGFCSMGFALPGAIAAEPRAARSGASWRSAATPGSS